MKEEKKIKIQQKKYNDFMVAAKTLFWKHGVRRVTVEEICREAGASKMTFYRQFSGKDAIASAVLDKIITTAMQNYLDIMKSEKSFPEKMKEVIELKRKSLSGISNEFLRDIHGGDFPEHKQRFQDYKETMKDLFKKDIEEAIEKGWIKPEFKPEFLMYMSDQLTDMLIDTKLLSMFDNSEEAIIGMTDFFFHGIMANNGQAT